MVDNCEVSAPSYRAKQLYKLIPDTSVERIINWQYQEQSRNAPGKSLLREENEDNGVQCLKWRHGLKIIANPGIIKKLTHLVM